MLYQSVWQDVLQLHGRYVSKTFAISRQIGDGVQSSNILPGRSLKLFRTGPTQFCSIQSLQYNILLDDGDIVVISQYCMDPRG